MEEEDFSEIEEEEEEDEQEQIEDLVDSDEVYAPSDQATGGKLCEVCQFLNSPGAPVCSMCETSRGSIKACSTCSANPSRNPCKSCSKLSTTKTLASCSACRAGRVEGYTFRGCVHTFCRICVAGIVQESLEQIRNEGVFQGLKCADLSCGDAFTRQDLRVVAGKDVLEVFDEWLCSSISKASETYNGNNNNLETRKRKKRKKKKTNMKTNSGGDCGIPWGPGMEKLFAAVVNLQALYQSSLYPTTRKFWSKRRSKKSDEKPTDSAFSQALKTLSESIKLVSLENGGRVPLAGTVLLCSNSTTREVLSLLLRNDSALDIASRTALHFELFSLLRTVSWFPELFPLVCCSVSDPKHDFWTDEAVYHPGSLMACLEKLHRQAKYILEKQQQEVGTTASGGGQKNSSSSVETALFEEARDLFEQLLGQIHMWRRTFSAWMTDADEFFKCGFVSSQNKVAAAAAISDTSEEDHYISSLKPFQFGQAPLRSSHYFRKSPDTPAAATPSAAAGHSRSRRIAKEIAGFSTHLPLHFNSSIHIRVDEHSMDFLRALIIGPESTPYENGIFLFDIFLKGSYPASPPKVQFLTTAAGRVCFNPNLYQCGKVCLSLLGTWDGPRWQPNSSTLLQLLVSLQSLVFVPEPYYNEPGLEEMKPKDGSEYLPSERYSYEQCFNTLRHSILPALRNPDAAFKDLIKAHFVSKRKRIEEQCERWRKLNVPADFYWSTTSVNDKMTMANAVDEVMSELAKVG